MQKVNGVAGGRLDPVVVRVEIRIGDLRQVHVRVEHLACRALIRLHRLRVERIIQRSDILRRAVLGLGVRVERPQIKPGDAAGIIDLHVSFSDFLLPFRHGELVGVTIFQIQNRFVDHDFRRSGFRLLKELFHGLLRDSASLLGLRVPVQIHDPSPEVKVCHRPGSQRQSQYRRQADDHDALTDVSAVLRLSIRHLHYLPNAVIGGVQNSHRLLNLLLFRHFNPPPSDVP